MAGADDFVAAASDDDVHAHAPDARKLVTARWSLDGVLHATDVPGAIEAFFVSTLASMSESGVLPHSCLCSAK